MIEEFCKYIKNAYVFTPKILEDVLRDPNRSNFDRNFLTFDENELKSKFIGFVTGRILEEKYLNGYLDINNKLILS